MDAEADIFTVFQGWNAETTKNMTLDELLLWHDKAVERHKASKEEGK